MLKIRHPAPGAPMLPTPMGLFSNTDNSWKILTLIKLKVEAGQRQHYIVGVTLLSTSFKTGLTTQSHIF